MKTRYSIRHLTIGLLLTIAPVANATVTVFTENFEARTPGNPLTLPWTWSVETFADNAGAPGAYVGGYYPGNDASPGIHSVIAGQSGAQGNNALQVYGDYGFPPNHTDNKWVTTNMYVNRTLTAADIVDGGLTFEFDFAALVGPGGLDTTTIAGVYFQLLSPGFNETYLRLFSPVTAADTAFQSGSLSMNLNGSNIGNQLQWGFTSQTQNYSSSAFLVDNLSVVGIPEPTGIALTALGAGLLLVRRRRA